MSKRPKPRQVPGREFEEMAFELETGNLVHAIWISGSRQSSALLVSVHHIAIDAWSVNQFVQQLANCYDCAG